MKLPFLKKYWSAFLITFLLISVATGFYIWNLAHELQTRDVPENPLFQNSDAPLPLRVADLLSYMTLEEKVGQMALVEKTV
ncbi:hypothetical protein IPH92_02145 [Candidatus Kaiserbacteria bacterium]|nr:MAG: hypothetical protein IPH92_02145 [Candidatus Kaiserbacteria bacterium]